MNTEKERDFDIMGRVVSIANKKNSCHEGTEGDITHGDDRNSIHNVHRATTSSSTTPQGQSSPTNIVLSTNQKWWNLWLITALIILGGGATSAAFVGLGISSAQMTQKDQFDRSASDLVRKIQTAWEDYVAAATMIHGRCRSRNFSRAEFRELYEYLTVGVGLDFQGILFSPNISREERPTAEAEARSYYAQYYPNVTYRGFVGFEHDNCSTLEYRSQQDYYFPVHYMEPVFINERAIDLDYQSSASRRRTVAACINTGKPAVTERLRLVTETDAVAYGVLLMHPGIRLSTHTDIWPRDLAAIGIRILDLLKRSTENQSVGFNVYVYDTSDQLGKAPVFLGGVAVKPQKGFTTEVIALPEVNWNELSGSKYQMYQTVNAANKFWTVAVLSVPDTFEPNVLFVILGGIVIFLASACLAIWVPTNAIRVARCSQVQAEADAEKAALILENVRQAAQAERELNDFMAHEVRNPVAAALAACSFVKRALHKETTLDNPELKETTLDDVQIIENSLQFVNDLLRNMLDMHRAASRQLQVNLTPTDILHDVLEPVQSMLLQRDRDVKVTVECPESLWVMSDRLRLNQVMMNLGTNSSKFVDTGFIRLQARIVCDENLNNEDQCNEFVELSVEDSGTGIPNEKRDFLFNKYQQSLDMLNQGTGIGLYLCKNLVELMGGTISFDDTYRSGISGCPGTRFVINLRQPSLEIGPGHWFSCNLEDSGILESIETGGDRWIAYGSRRNLQDSNSHNDEENDVRDTHMGPRDVVLLPKLPESLSVLFVDDDMILRKLFSRMIHLVCPQWTIREASNGETAIRLCDTISFDLIFMDMYMASVQKQLLGTETVEILRNKGIQSTICGLSANDMEMKFKEAGADTFAFKPFPCEPQALTQELSRILGMKRHE